MFSLLTNFGFALPVVCIYGLGQVAKIMEQGGFANTRDLIFDSIGQALIEVSLEGSLSVSSYLQGVSIELDNVFVYSLAILHHEVSQLMLHITLWVMRAC